MGLFDFLENRYFSKEALKRRVISVYKRHYKRMEGSGRHYLVIHSYALSETLKSWCTYHGESYLDEKIYAEILPFSMMEVNMSLDLFCEYLMYRSHIEGYNNYLLRKNFNEVINDCLINNQKYISRLSLQYNYHLAWYDLLDSEVHKKVFNI